MELSSILSGLMAVLLLSSFVKIFTSLTILRYGLGLETASFGVVIAGVSLALSLAVVSPQLDKVGGMGVVFGAASSLNEANLEKSFRPFLEKHTSPELHARLSQVVSKHQEPTEAAPKDSFALLIASFLISQLKEAFQLGFLILIPFLVIDLIVTNILMVLNITQMSQAAVALPFKILLFFVVDGWSLISEKLISSYF